MERLQTHGRVIQSVKRGRNGVSAHTDQRAYLSGYLWSLAKEPNRFQSVCCFGHSQLPSLVLFPKHRTHTNKNVLHYHCTTAGKKKQGFNKQLSCFDAQSINFPSDLFVSCSSPPAQIVCINQKRNINTWLARKQANVHIITERERKV